jgi:hypothetical protein
MPSHIPSGRMQWSRPFFCEGISPKILQLYSLAITRTILFSFSSSARRLSPLHVICDAQVIFSVNRLDKAEVSVQSLEFYNKYVNYGHDSQLG